ncbi:MAG TPA: DNA translocase FtsK [Acidimicrobiales bacterium]|nr:DNA translocase FtsK [Acidimicrobiales bacterium]
MLDSAIVVLASHAEDLWGITLVTLGILAAIALYGGALGPIGHDVRHGLGAAFGVGRLLLPPALVAAGALLVVGRPHHEPARLVLGVALALAAVAGLADLAGGSPHVSASTAALTNAGGWLGAAIGGPLEAGLAGVGAAIFLLAVLALALVIFTGITLRRAATACAGALVRGWRSVTRALEGRVTSVDLSTVREGSASSPGEALVAVPLGDIGVGETAAPDPADDVAGQSEEDAELPHAVTEGQEESAKSTVGSGADDAMGLPSGAMAVSGSPLTLDAGLADGEWRLPPSKLLSRSKPQQLDRGEVAAAGDALVDALRAHGVETRLVGRTVGPTVTRFELELGPGVKVARVTSLAKDIAYAMASPDVRILAPIPGKSAIGVEVPNRRRQLVTLGDVLTSDEARTATHPLEVALGRDIAGRAVMANLADMPHILISGATGAGKSSCINSLLTSILMRATPEEVRLILVDPKRVELGQYNGLPHLLTQVVVDPKKAANALSWAVTEMERRYDLLAEAGMRDITGYNEAVVADDLAGPAGGSGSEDADLDAAVDSPTGELLSGGRADGEGEADATVTMPVTPSVSTAVAQRMAESRTSIDPPVRRESLPFILVVVDELNDLMMVAARDVEESVCRIAQMARAVGIHLVLATQRPSVDVITGVIKANVPSRLAFSVSSLADSRVILDQPGAERLVGKGDMLLLTASSSVPRRIQGPWVTENEVRTVVGHWRRQRQATYVEGIAVADGPSATGAGTDDDDDDLLPAAMELVVRSQLGSTSMLQRKLRVGFSRAGRLMDLLERRGVVGPSEGSKARAVLMTPDELDQRVGG